MPALTLSEQAELGSLLFSAFSHAEMENLAAKLHLDLRTIASQRDTDDLIARNIVQHFVRQGEAPTRVLVARLLRERPDHGDIREFSQRHFPGLEHQREARSPVHDLILYEEVLILDRRELREQLRLLNSARHPKKVLLVRGGPDSGKSHGRYLFQHLAEEQGGEAIYLCEGLVSTLDDVLMELFSAVGASDQIPAVQTSPEAWYKVVCARLKEIVANKTRRVLWIAIDDLGCADDGSPLLVEEIRHFFDQFAMQMLNPNFNQWFRLMLMHYPDAVPTRWHDDFWCEERLDPDGIAQADVEEALREWSAKTGLRILEEDVSRLAKSIIDQADPSPLPDASAHCRLKRLHQAVLQQFKELKRRPA